MTITTTTTTTTTTRKFIARKNLGKYLEIGMGNCRWYESSNASAMRFCSANNLDLKTFLAVTAILSPRVQVVRNIRLAKQWVLENKNPNGIMMQRQRALAHYHATGIVSGTKIQAFNDSLNLVDGAVCIDTHMSSLFGFPGGELMGKTKRQIALREAACRAIGKMADQYSIPTYGVQAALWVGYLIAEKGYTFDRFKPMDFEG